MDIVQCVTQIVTAYISRNNLPPAKLPELIEAVHHALSQLVIGGQRSGHQHNAQGTTEQRGTPAVPIRASVQPTYLVCLEDGKKMKSLKRHLRAAHDMSIAQYIARWNLSPDYPTVAPNYSVLRSQLAKTSGLGTASNARKTGKK